MFPERQFHSIASHNLKQFCLPRLIRYIVDASAFTNYMCDWYNIVWDNDQHTNKTMTPGKQVTKYKNLKLIFRLFRFILFLVNWISSYFFHIIWNTTILCLLLLYFDWVVIGHSDFFLCSFTSFLTHASLLNFFTCFCILFHSCCSHAQFGKHSSMSSLFPIDVLNGTYFSLIL